MSWTNKEQQQWHTYITILNSLGTVLLLCSKDHLIHLYDSHFLAGAILYAISILNRENWNKKKPSKAVFILNRVASRVVMKNYQVKAA